MAAAPPTQLLSVLPNDPVPSAFGCARIFLSTALTTPFRTARVLIQLGYEPCPEYASVSFPWCKPGFRRLPLFAYLRAIYREHGSVGLYSGAVSCGLAGVVHSVTKGYAKQSLRDLTGVPLPLPVKEGEFPPLEVLGKEMALDIAAGCVATAVAQPLIVCCNRVIAQLVDGESLYGDAVGLSQLWKEGDLFKGLVPALLCVVAVGATVPLVAAGINYALPPADQLAGPLQPGTAPEAKDQILAQIQKLRGMTVAMGARTLMAKFSYPLGLVSTMMTVNGTQLALGHEPAVPIFEGWWQCAEYNYNYAGFTTRGLMRGSANLFRFYKTPLPPLARVTAE
eukprot:m.482246 g.482246  ORF g.482246 m.482246 type:complete len:338 (+) comp22480_c0_seq1:57-1070(+)